MKQNRGENMKKDVWEEQDFYLNCLKNIVKTKDGKYELQPVYELVGDKILETEENKNNPTSKNDKQCCLCIYHDICNNCLMRTKLERLPKYQYIPDHYQNKCDAYTPIHALSVISSKDEMIDFIEKVENFFRCPEDYESYFGICRNYNEETGEVLETTREYYNRGGKFNNIPDIYPCVVYFPYGDISNSSYTTTDFQWIYIGDNSIERRAYVWMNI